MGFVGWIFSVHAAETVPPKIHHFTLIGVDTIKIGEAMDITVEARDKDDKVIPTYKGSVFFQASDYNATLPSQGKAIQFSEVDKWVKKLSKAVIFKKTGEQSLEVSDAVEDASGKKSIRVEASETTSTGNIEAITIITPENNAILSMGDLITVSGYGKKNSKLAIKLNGGDIATVIADENGLYSKTLPSLTQQSNIVVVELLDATNKVLTSSQVRFSLTNKDPIFNNLVITPATSVEIGTGITLTVEAEAGLTEVTVSIDGSVTVLKESGPGKYTGLTRAPAKSWVYAVNVNLKNALSQWVSKTGVVNLTVKDKAPAPVGKFLDVRTETRGTKVEFLFQVQNLPADLVKFKIAYGENPDSLSEQVITYEATKIVNGSGQYSWYIDKLEPKKYTFRIFGLKEDQSIISDFASDPVQITIWKPECSIGNVWEITVQTAPDSSTLSWSSVTGAISYNIYKYTAAGDAEFIKNTADTSYVLFLSSGSVLHEDFGLKALCDDATESADMTKVSKVQTGPSGVIAILVVISALLTVVLMRRRVS